MKLTLNTIGSRYGSIDALNANFEAIADAFENTFSRDGQGPNMLESNVDANSYRIINLPAPVFGTEAVNKDYVEQYFARIYAYLDAIATVADNIDAVVKVADAADEIVENIDAIVAVGTNIEDVITVADNIGSVEVVALELNGAWQSGVIYDFGSITEDPVGEVETVESSIITVGTNIEHVIAVSENIEAVVTAADNIDVMNSVMENIVDIQNAEENAAAAAASAEAASTSEGNAEDSASAALASEEAAQLAETNAEIALSAAEALYDNFDDRYLGVKDSDPSVDNDGDALLEGALYWNSVAKELRIYNTVNWTSFSGLPSQSGNNGKYLKTNGTTAGWDEITVDEVVPSQTGNNGKFLTTDGTNASWGLVPDPQPATPTDDGLVYGFTPTGDAITVGGWTPFTSTYLSFGGNSFSWNYIATGGYSGWVTSNVVVGDPVYVTIGGTEEYYGVVTELFSHSEPGYFYTSFSVSNPEEHPSFSYGSSVTLSSPLVTQGGNVSLGYSSNEEGASNTAVGYEAGNTITTGTNLTVVGYGALPSSATATNEVTLGNSDVTKTRLFGALAVNDSTGTTGQVLTSNGAGTATWATITAPVTSVNGETGAVVLDATDVGAATSAQGALADSAVQPGDGVSTLTNDAGYITGYTETDPVYVASSWYTTTNNAANWNTAYGWGNHASAGYLTAIPDGSITSAKLAATIDYGSIV